MFLRNEEVPESVRNQTSYRAFEEEKRKLLIRHIRSLASFFLLGLCNMFCPMVLITAAEDIMGINTIDVHTNRTYQSTERHCSNFGTGAVILVYIITGTIVSLIVPFLPWFIHMRIFMAIALSVVGFCITSVARRALAVAVIGVVLISMAEALGEATCLQYTAYYHVNVISTWSSGTGTAGLLPQKTHGSKKDQVNSSEASSYHGPHNGYRLQDNSLLHLDIEAACYGACGIGSGVDVCTDHCQPLVVRPQEIPKPPQATLSLPGPPIKVPLPMTPLGGPCFCRRPTVKPAVIPKPVCGTCRRRVCNSCNSCRRDQRTEEEIIDNYGCDGNSFGAYDPLPSLGPIAPGIPGVPGLSGLPGAFSPYPVNLPETREQLAPADPVSVAIAYNLARKNQQLKEDILTFGFRQIPKEVPVQQRQRDAIPEENLYSLNGAVVELKPVQTLGKSVDEEAAEQLMELQEEETVGESGVRKLTLGEVGYGLAKATPKATYVNIPLSPFQVPECKNPGGYVPGKVITNLVPKLEPVLIPPGPPEPCAAVSPCRYTNKGEFGSFGRFSSKSSSSSSSKSSHSGILIHKLFD